MLKLVVVFVRGSSIVLCVLLLGSCSSTPQPVSSPAMAGGTTKAPGNRTPYVVFGKRYEVMPESLGYLEIGIASWYGKKFHGRLTANGETYNMYGLTAAHKSLPLPTIVRVTNLDNGKKTILRVNDRGPFHADRVIDLSYKAALELGFADKGTAPVVVEAIDERNYFGRDKPVILSAAKDLPSHEDKPATPSAAKDLPGGGASYFLQAGAFSRVEGARELLRKIQELLAGHGGGVQARILQSELETGILHKVWIGPIGTESDEAEISMLVADTLASKPIKIEIE